MAGARDRAVILVASETGARPGELLSLFPEHVDLAGMGLMARPISPRCAEALGEWLTVREKIVGGVRPDLPLFVTVRAGVDRLAITRGREPMERAAGEGMSESGLRVALRSASKRAGSADPVTMRSLRHYAQSLGCPACGYGAAAQQRGDAP
jgi:integrase